MAEYINNQQIKGNPPERGFPWYIQGSLKLFICLLMIFILTLISCSPDNPPSNENQNDILKCAIVDQLYIIEPNPVFIDYVTGELEDFGFEVDIFHGEEVDIDFYRKLPTHGYKLIIFRVHAGLLENEEGISNTIWMFTSEHYNRMRYFIAQMRDQVRAAGTSMDTQPVFAISPKFITDCMEGDFSNTVIINMGCAAFYTDELAQTFVNKGASAYLAWDVSVGLHYVDSATMTLVEKLCSDNLSISDAVKETMEEKGPDPNNNAFLYYYPQINAAKNLRELTE